MLVGAIAQLDFAYIDKMSIVKLDIILQECLGYNVGELYYMKSLRLRSLSILITMRYCWKSWL